MSEEEFDGEEGSLEGEAPEEEVSVCSYKECILYANLQSLQAPPLFI